MSASACTTSKPRSLSPRGEGWGGGAHHEFPLKDLHKNIKHFAFIAGYRTQTITPQNPVNIKAAERMGKLHDALKAAGYTGHPLEVLLVRLLFCLFAEDTGIFQPASALRAWIEERTAADGSDLGAQLAQLFQVLNTLEDKRSKNLDEQIAAFPYVNGKLFEEMLSIASFDLAMREALLDCCALDWSAISPAIPDPHAASAGVWLVEIDSACLMVQSMIICTYNENLLIIKVKGE